MVRVMKRTTEIIQSVMRSASRADADAVAAPGGVAAAAAADAAAVVEHVGVAAVAPEDAGASTCAMRLLPGIVHMIAF
jgi:hypothetical protein